ncbi:helix-turn-helix transcriptional regulator [Saccharomonospora xinjiangensis]|uniref:Putative transcriptional regulator n=1 Tax=Saccharomonospora xinjiangensis XJ-54 TaxID=882086 RepID=I0V0V5_9PSEU|nr:YafY family protein [Saccharomonospora xinjiangensis]EID53758.1 putative transcriptional regulator [Saccharomonospora xinjiangensis XJ-54]
MLETSARLLRLLALLQTPREWRGTELATRLDVSPRTVRNDIERLRTLGYPVHATRGSSGGYRLEAGANVPPLLLDDDEAVAVAVGLRTAAGGSITGIEETSLRALAKLERVLPSRLRHRLNALTTYTTAVPRDDRGPTVNADVLTTLVTAARDHEILRFDYRAHDGEQSRRITEPHRVVTWGRRWYLLAWDVEREDWRTYRVDRMTPKIPTGPRFTPREIPGGDAAAHVSRGVSSAAWRHRASVVVHAPAAKVTERLSPAVGVVEAIDEHTCVLHTGADTVEVLAVYLGLLGAPFEVTDPPELVAHVRELASRYAAATPSGKNEVGT